MMFKIYENAYSTCGKNVTHKTAKIESIIKNVLILINVYIALPLVITQPNNFEWMINE